MPVSCSCSKLLILESKCTCKKLFFGESTVLASSSFPITKLDELGCMLPKDVSQLVAGGIPVVLYKSRNSTSQLLVKQFAAGVTPTAPIKLAFQGQILIFIELRTKQIRSTFHLGGDDRAVFNICLQHTMACRCMPFGQRCFLRSTFHLGVDDRAVFNICLQHIQYHHGV